MISVRDELTSRTQHVVKTNARVGRKCKKLFIASENGSPAGHVINIVYWVITTDDLVYARHGGPYGRIVGLPNLYAATAASAGIDRWTPAGQWWAKVN